LTHYSIIDSPIICLPKQKPTKDEEPKRHPLVTKVTRALPQRLLSSDLPDLVRQKDKVQTQKLGVLLINKKKY